MVSNCSGLTTSQTAISELVMGLLYCYSTKTPNSKFTHNSDISFKLQVLIDTLKLLLDALLPESSSTTPVLILGDFNVNLLEESSKKKKLQKFFQEQRQFTQIISQCTTDYHSLLDHIYTNIPAQVDHSGTLESYFSDHKPIFICLSHGK